MGGTTHTAKYRLKLGGSSGDLWVGRKKKINVETMEKQIISVG